MVNKIESEEKHYFVDEAGDGTLFNRRGEILLGTPGCSSYFMLGFVEISEPHTVLSKMHALHNSIIEDPYFQGVPSLNPVNHKTAISFHAKDDLPEIRKQVFDLLKNEKIKFYAVVKEKSKVLTYVRQRNLSDGKYRYNQNELYDLTARQLFKDKLHKAQNHTITFAKRGSSNRTDALRESLDTAKQKFLDKFKLESNSGIKIQVDLASKNLGLQVVDYYLWALQRLYERKEQRYIQYLKNQIRLIIDIDDIRLQKYGAYYTNRNPITLEKIIRFPEDIGSST